MDAQCIKCLCSLNDGGQIIYASGKSFHLDCFACCYCFTPFMESQYFEINGYFYCIEDYEKLFAPICSECGKGIIGKVVKAQQLSWHEGCFQCSDCKKVLENSSNCTFFQNRIICKVCSDLVQKDSYICTTCKSYIHPNKHIFYRQVPVHPWHYLCNRCGNELTEDAEEHMGKLYCKYCYDHNHATVCYGCKKCIKGERSICSDEKNFHTAHFRCSKCGVLFINKAHYTKDNFIYCEQHFREFFGKICYLCKVGVAGGETIINQRVHCYQHFVCYICLGILDQKNIADFDGKPICKKCYEKLPLKLKKSLKEESK